MVGEGGTAGEELASGLLLSPVISVRLRSHTSQEALDISSLAEMVLSSFMSSSFPLTDPDQQKPWSLIIDVCSSHRSEMVFELDFS